MTDELPYAKGIQGILKRLEELDRQEAFVQELLELMIKPLEEHEPGLFCCFCVHAEPFTEDE